MSENTTNNQEKNNNQELPQVSPELVQKAKDEITKLKTEILTGGKSKKEVLDEIKNIFDPQSIPLVGEDLTRSITSAQEIIDMSPETVDFDVILADISTYLDQLPAPEIEAEVETGSNSTAKEKHNASDVFVEYKNLMEEAEAIILKLSPEEGVKMAQLIDGATPETLQEIIAAYNEEEQKNPVEERSEEAELTEDPEELSSLINEAEDLIFEVEQEEGKEIEKAIKTKDPETIKKMIEDYKKDQANSTKNQEKDTKTEETNTEQKAEAEAKAIKQLRKLETDIWLTNTTNIARFRELESELQNLSKDLPISENNAVYEAQNTLRLRIARAEQSSEKLSALNSKFTPGDTIRLVQRNPREFELEANTTGLTSKTEGELESPFAFGQDPKIKGSFAFLKIAVVFTDDSGKFYIQDDLGKLFRVDMVKEGEGNKEVNDAERQDSNKSEKSTNLSSIDRRLTGLEESLKDKNIALKTIKSALDRFENKNEPQTDLQKKRLQTIKDAIEQLEKDKAQEELVEESTKKLDELEKDFDTTKNPNQEFLLQLIQNEEDESGTEVNKDKRQKLREKIKAGKKTKEEEKAEQESRQFNAGVMLKIDIINNQIKNKQIGIALLTYGTLSQLIEKSVHKLDDDTQKAVDTLKEEIKKTEETLEKTKQALDALNKLVLSSTLVKITKNGKILTGKISKQVIVGDTLEAADKKGNTITSRKVVSATLENGIYAVTIESGSEYKIEAAPAQREIMLGIEFKAEMATTEGYIKNHEFSNADKNHQALLERIEKGDYTPNPTEASKIEKTTEAINEGLANNEGTSVEIVEKAAERLKSIIKLWNIEKKPIEFNKEYQANEKILLTFTDENYRAFENDNTASQLQFEASGYKKIHEESLNFLKKFKVPVNTDIEVTLAGQPVIETQLTQPIVIGLPFATKDQTYNNDWVFTVDSADADKLTFTDHTGRVFTVEKADNAVEKEKLKNIAEAVATLNEAQIAWLANDSKKFKQDYDDAQLIISNNSLDTEPEFDTITFPRTVGTNNKVVNSEAFNCAEYTKEYKQSETVISNFTSSLNSGDKVLIKNLSAPTQPLTPVAIQGDLEMGKLISTNGGNFGLLFVMTENNGDYSFKNKAGEIYTIEKAPATPVKSPDQIRDEKVLQKLTDAESIVHTEPVKVSKIIKKQEEIYTKANVQIPQTIREQITDLQRSIKAAHETIGAQVISELKLDQQNTMIEIIGANGNSGAPFKGSLDTPITTPPTFPLKMTGPNFSADVDYFAKSAGANARYFANHPSGNWEIKLQRTQNRNSPQPSQAIPTPTNPSNFDVKDRSWKEKRQLGWNNMIGKEKSKTEAQLKINPDLELLVNSTMNLDAITEIKDLNEKRQEFTKQEFAFNKVKNKIAEIEKDLEDNKKKKTQAVKNKEHAKLKGLSTKRQELRTQLALEQTKLVKLEKDQKDAKDKYHQSLQTVAKKDKEIRDSRNQSEEEAKVALMKKYVFDEKEQLNQERLNQLPNGLRQIRKILDWYNKLPWYKQRVLGTVVITMIITAGGTAAAAIGLMAAGGASTSAILAGIGTKVAASLALGGATETVAQAVGLDTRQADTVDLEHSMDSKQLDPNALVNNIGKIQEEYQAGIDKIELSDQKKAKRRNWVKKIAMVGGIMAWAGSSFGANTSAAEEITQGSPKPAASADAYNSAPEKGIPDTTPGPAQSAPIAESDSTLKDLVKNYFDQGDSTNVDSTETPGSAVDSTESANEEVTNPLKNNVEPQTAQPLNPEEIPQTLVREGDGISQVIKRGLESSGKMNEAFQAAESAGFLGKIDTPEFYEFIMEQTGYMNEAGQEIRLTADAIGNTQYELNTDGGEISIKEIRGAYEMNEAGEIFKVENGTTSTEIHTTGTKFEGPEHEPDEKVWSKPAPKAEKPSDDFIFKGLRHTEPDFYESGKPGTEGLIITQPDFSEFGETDITSDDFDRWDNDVNTDKSSNSEIVWKGSPLKSDFSDVGTPVPAEPLPTTAENPFGLTQNTPKYNQLISNFNTISNAMDNETWHKEFTKMIGEKTFYNEDGSVMDTKEALAKEARLVAGEKSGYLNLKVTVNPETGHIEETYTGDSDDIVEKLSYKHVGEVDIEMSKAMAGKGIRIDGELHKPEFRLNKSMIEKTWSTLQNMKIPKAYLTDSYDKLFPPGTAPGLKVENFTAKINELYQAEGLNIQITEEQAKMMLNIKKAYGKLMFDHGIENNHNKNLRSLLGNIKDVRFKQEMIAKFGTAKK